MMHISAVLAHHWENAPTRRAKEEASQSDDGKDTQP